MLVSMFILSPFPGTVFDKVSIADYLVARMKYAIIELMYEA